METIPRPAPACLGRGACKRPMPSLSHEELVELFRAAPELAVELIRDVCPLPPFERIDVRPADLTELVPVAYRADAFVVLFRGDVPVFGIVIEVQLGRDVEKWLSWPFYQAAGRARHGCPVCLVVYAPDRAVAAWAQEPIDTGQPGSPFRPVVRGPGAIAKVTDPAEAAAHPHRAVLSALAHADEPDGLEVAKAAILGLSGQTEDERIVWETAILDALNGAARVALEAWMNLAKFPIEKTWVYKKGQTEGKIEGKVEGKIEGKAEGEASALLRVLERRGVAVPDDARARILACTDLALLEAWLDRAVVAARIEEIFAER